MRIKEEGARQGRREATFPVPPDDHGTAEPLAEKDPGRSQSVGRASMNPDQPRYRPPTTRSSPQRRCLNPVVAEDPGVAHARLVWTDGEGPPDGDAAANGSAWD